MSESPVVFMGAFLISRVRNASLVSTRSTTTSLCVVLLRLVVMVFFRLVLPVLLYRIAYFCCGFEQVFYLVLLFGMSLPGLCGEGFVFGVELGAVLFVCPVCGGVHQYGCAWDAGGA